MVLVATGGVEPPSLLSPLCERDRCSTDELCGRMSPPCGRLGNYKYVNNIVKHSPKPS